MRLATPRWLSVGLALLLCVPLAEADSPLPPPALVTRCSPNREHCATADPKADSIVVYRMRGAERADTLWSVKGWRRVFELADGGQDLIVCLGGMNLLPVDYSPDQEMLTFFHGGNIVRRVTLRELVPDLSRLQRTVSHYEWGE